MAKIRLQKDIVVFQGQTQEISTRQFIETALNSSDPAKGLTIKDIRSRLKLDKVIDTITPESAEVVIEGDDLITLQEALESVKWNGRTRLLNELIEDVYA